MLGFLGLSTSQNLDYYPIGNSSLLRLQEVEPFCTEKVLLYPGGMNREALSNSQIKESSAFFFWHRSQCMTSRSEIVQQIKPFCNDW
jgi:hypothetical protein